MVNRCYYYADGNTVRRKDIQIEWECGFTRDAKRIYISRILNSVQDVHRPCIDVTTASPDYLARSLSPHLLVHADGGKFDRIYKWKITQPQHDYLYWQWLSEEQRDYIMRYKSFTDVFHDPLKKGINTQAHTIAVLQLMMLQDMEYLTENITEFTEWWEDVVKRGEEVLCQRN